MVRIWVTYGDPLVKPPPPALQNRWNSLFQRGVTSIIGRAPTGCISLCAQRRAKAYSYATDNCAREGGVEPSDTQRCVSILSVDTIVRGTISRDHMNTHNTAWNIGIKPSCGTWSPHGRQKRHRTQVHTQYTLRLKMVPENTGNYRH